MQICMYILCWHLHVLPLDLPLQFYWWAKLDLSEDSKNLQWKELGDLPKSVNLEQEGPSSDYLVHGEIQPTLVSTDIQLIAGHLISSLFWHSLYNI